MKLIAVSLALAMLVAVPLGCKPKGAKVPTGGILNDWITSDPAGIDPQIDTTLMVYSFSRDIFSTLLRYKGETLELEPELLEEMPKGSADGLTFSFKLKKNVKFHDGKTVLTAKDVKFTMERMLTPATGAANGWVYETIKGAKDMLNGKATTLAGFKLKNDYEFDLVLEEPFTPFLSNLAIPPASIYSEALVKAAGDGWKMKPVGTGPFMLKEYVPDSHIYLVKNPNYFEKGLPYLDGVRTRILPDSATGQLEFEKGTVDYLMVPTAEFDRFIKAGKDGKWQIQESVPLATYYFMINMNDIPDVRVRRAIGLAIDKQKIVDTILGGRGSVATTFISPGIPGRDPNAKGFPFNLDEAKKLMAEAGVSSMKLEIWQRGGTQATDTNLAIQEMLGKIGIEISIRIADSASYRETRGQGKIPANFGNWWADFGDPDNYFYTFFHSTQSKSMSSNYSNPEVDKLIDQARKETDQAKRNQIYIQLEQKIIQQDAAAIPLYYIKRYRAVQNGIKGFTMHPTGVNSFREVYKESTK